MIFVELNFKNKLYLSALNYSAFLFPSIGAASLRHAYNFIQANKVLNITVDTVDIILFISLIRRKSASDLKETNFSPNI